MHSYGTKEWFEQMFSKAHEGLDNWGHQWRAGQQYRYLLSLELIKPLLSRKKSQVILDIGCGLGDFTQLMYRVNVRNQFYGMDISRNAINGATKKYPKFHFICAALPEIGCEEKFDGITSLDCLCYLNHQSRNDSAKNIYSRLKSNGWYLFSSPLDDGTRYFSRKQAIEVIQTAGFKIEHVCYNHARIYNLFEMPFLKMTNLHRIISEISRDDDRPMTPRTEKLRRVIKLPILGKLIRTAAKRFNGLSYWVLGSINIVNVFQWTSRNFFKGRGVSHILILASKSE